ncbi:sensor histidine kinase [Cellulomonas sp. P5_C6]
MTARVRGVLGGLLGVVAVRASTSPMVWLPDVAVGAAWCGVAGWGTPRHRPFAVLAAGVALAWYAADLWPATVFWHRAVLVALLLAMPAWWPTTRVAGMAVVLVGAASALVSPWDSALGAAGLSAALVLALLLERRPARGRRRHQRTTALRAGCVLAVTFVVPPAVTALSTASSALPALIGYEAVLVATAPVLARSLRATSAPQATDLVVELGEAGSGVLVDDLRRALRDPDLQLWSLDEVPGADAAPGRTRTTVVAAGRPVAVIDHDTELLAEPALLAAVDDAARLTLTNAMLQTQVQAQLDELTLSRQRLITSAARERADVRTQIETGSGARIQELLAELADQDDPHLRRVAEHLRATRDDLRRLTLGLSPSAASDSLDRVLHELASACPVPTTVDATDVPLTDAVRAAIYLICAEALTNVAKHARASTVAIVAREHPGGTLELSVVDDGAGGAARDRGAGLTGVYDRVASVGGMVELDSPTGSGTRLVVRVPVAGGRS